MSSSNNRLSRAFLSRKKKRPAKVRRKKLRRSESKHWVYMS